MRDEPPRGMAGLDAALWRSVAVYRALALVYAAVVIGKNSGGYAHPLGGWAVLGVLTVWTGVATLAYRDPSRRGWPLLAADLAVAFGCILATAWVETADHIAAGRPTLPVSWVAASVLAWAVAGGRRLGVTAALVLGAANLLVHAVAGTAGGMGNTTLNGIVSNYGAPTGSDPTLFPTNLSWLSFRILHPDTTTPLSSYPNNASIVVGNPVAFSVASALQLVVTGIIPQGQQNTTQQMTIPAGQLAQWNVDMTNGTNPVELFKITNINFVIPTCTAAVDPTVVTLSAVSTTAFTGNGSTAGQQPFQVQLNCVSGANLSITLSTTSHFGNNNLGVINNATGTGYAQNVGVQILKQDGSTPVTFGKAISEGATQNGTMNLAFYARYYQNSTTNVTVGQVSATATYTLTYN